MPDATVRAPGSDRVAALAIVCVLAVASVVIAVLGAGPDRVSARELLGDARTPGDRAFIASHRGGAAAAPENTLPAVQAALDAGFDYVEVDFALTADRQIVLMHDATVDRTTDGHGRLAQLTLAQVRELDAGSWFDASFAGTPVPTAAEFLDVLAASGRRAIVELKGEWDAASAAAFVAEVAARSLDQQIIVASFDARTLAAVESAGTHLPLLIILKRLPADVVAAARQFSAQGILVARRAVLEQPHIVDELHHAGLRIVVYTLNSDEQWDAATALGVDGIVTDDPALLATWQQQVLADD
ncbi:MULTISPECIES: glycerophosphodiester phosphodiesterase family protein [unclassified Microbacterium]|uniref:glycerophosphodiester phosphodiesterase n=1 Tax=unclassified Microbacterium TaxID=2609290 RepID=UPI00214AC71A|nr:MULTISPECIES: glycerophosphodiester phosphodiesterase family protein [unclassified Microbacterium]MCR2786051.1 hypothetical protein [Microbacterium sp. zg.B96]MDL5352974.1 glycerophosphodiester phosphodiesterase family protein [Microbacterium sp. zg-YB36]WIM16918.1 glycerophosphodiester phosphodiesterase family protein [Microbacterium sp. zg-B96]